jgi:hypothetical protein
MNNLFYLFTLFLKQSIFMLMTAYTNLRLKPLFVELVLFLIRGLMLAKAFMYFLNFVNLQLKNLRNLYVEFFDDDVLLTNNRDLLPLGMQESKRIFTCLI